MLTDDAPLDPCQSEILVLARFQIESWSTLLAEDVQHADVRPPDITIDLHIHHVDCDPSCLTTKHRRIAQDLMLTCCAPRGLRVVSCPDSSVPCSFSPRAVGPSRPRRPTPVPGKQKHLGVLGVYPVRA